jgi:hypothetical protein
MKTVNFECFAHYCTPVEVPSAHGCVRVVGQAVYYLVPSASGVCLSGVSAANAFHCRRRTTDHTSMRGADHDSLNSPPLYVGSLGSRPLIVPQPPLERAAVSAASFGRHRCRRYSVRRVSDPRLPGHSVNIILSPSTSSMSTSLAEPLRRRRHTPNHVGLVVVRRHPLLPLLTTSHAASAGP